jgi:rRNA-processing protein FCF1
VLTPPARWRGKGLLVDTNILILYAVGRLDPHLIAKHKRTSNFTAEDYRFLKQLLRGFPRLATTPNVLTEVSNLLDQIGGAPRARLQTVLGGLVEVLDERYVPSIDATRAEEFQRLGLADSSILLLARQDFLVLTDDLPLYLALLRRGIDAINFHHVRRAAGWG